MKKIVLTFGLLAGAILSLMMVITMPFHDRLGFDKAEVIGYTSMVVAFLLIFFGIRSYRDNVGGGSVRFLPAFGIGALITMVAAICYVATWQVIKDRVAPDYMAKYQTHILEEARRNGDTDAEIAAKKAEMDRFAELYKNPFVSIAFTFMEPLPVGLIVTLVSAGILSRRRKDDAERPGTLRTPARSASIS